MLFSNDFIKEEHRYRTDAIRDQAPTGTGRLGRVVTVTVVAAILSVALAACGVPPETDAVAPAQSQVFYDQGPIWQPNVRLLRDILRTSQSDVQVVAPVEEFGGMTAPSWHPNYGRLETFVGAEPSSGSR